MQRLDRINAWDLTEDVATVRRNSGIGDKVKLMGKEYKVYTPSVVLFEDRSDLHRYVVQRLVGAISDHGLGPNTPTGNTYKPIWQEAAERKSELYRLLRDKELGGLDEYHPIDPGEVNYSQTYEYYRRMLIANPLGLDMAQFIAPDGKNPDGNAETLRFKGRLADSKWSITLLGIGPDEKTVQGRAVPASAHIGFVPPGTAPDQGAMYIRLDEGTIYANSQGAPDPNNFYRNAITQGPREIGQAYEHLLAATGTNKKQNIRKVLFTEPSLDIPASLVNLYPQTTIVLDDEAAELVLAEVNKLPQEATIFPSAKI